MIYFREDLFTSVLDYYCSIGYTILNGYLLGYRDNTQNEKIIQKKIEDMNKLFHVAEEDLVVYRGITHEFCEGGQKCYVSTSRNIKVAKKFTAEDEVYYLLEIHIRKGQMILDTNLTPDGCDEMEIILPIDTYLSIIEKLDKRIICRVIELP